MTEQTEDTQQCDVVIVGAGAAGLSAGIVLARAQARVHLIDEGHPRNAPAAAMHGFISRDGISPREFLGTAQAEFARYGGTLLDRRVVAVARRDDGRFDVRAGAETTAARAILVATGLTDELPDLPGVRELWGTGVHHCPHCHGYEVRGRNIVLLAGPILPMTLHQAALLRRHSDRVTLCTDGREIPAPQRARLEAFGIRIVDGAVATVEHENGQVTGLILADGGRVEAEALFVGPRPIVHDGLLRELGCATDPDTGLVTVDATGETSLPGVWAAGNVVDPRAQVISAAGQGSTAALAITGRLLEQDLDAAAGASPPMQ